MRALTSQIAVVAATVGVADQATKTLARALLPLCETYGSPSCEPVQIFGPARVVQVANGGSALGFGQEQVVWILLSLAGTIITLAYVRRRSGLLLGVAAGLQLGCGLEPGRPGHDGARDRLRSRRTGRDQHRRRRARRRHRDRRVGAREGIDAETLETIGEGGDTEMTTIRRILVALAPVAVLVMTARPGWDTDEEPIPSSFAGAAGCSLAYDG